jgi:hypothetical protein
MAMSFFAGWPFWGWINKRAASDAMYARTQSLVEKSPQLRPAWDVALQDKVLTSPEARIIILAAGETAEPDE